MPTRLRRLFVRDADDTRWQQWILLLVALIAALILRIALVPDFTGDFTDFGKVWVQLYRREGFLGLGDNSPNYNPPYLYLLWLGTLIPGLSDLAVIKVVGDVLDLGLAVGVGAVIWELRGSVFVTIAGAIAALFLPEVFLNSAFWGQADAGYALFLVWAAFYLLRNRGKGTATGYGAWVMFGLAFSFKLQALFFLPWMALAFVVQKHRVQAVLLGLLAFLATYIPALFAGRTVVQLSVIYIHQSQSQSSALSAHAANLYDWVPNTYATSVYPAGEWFAIAVVALLGALYLRRARLLEGLPTGYWLLQVAAALGVLVPFILPGMHERYAYPGNLLAALLILVDRRYLIPAILLQLGALASYAPYMLNSTPIPLSIVALGKLVAVVWVVVLSLTRMSTGPLPLFPVRPLAVATQAPIAAESSDAEKEPTPEPDAAA